MDMFEHCRYCVAPKRHPGCHSTCPEYKQDRENYNTMKAELDKKKKMYDEIYHQREKQMRRIIRGRYK